MAPFNSNNEVTLIEDYVLALSINCLNEFSQLSCDLGTVRASILQMRNLRSKSCEAEGPRYRGQQGTPGWPDANTPALSYVLGFFHQS